MSSSSEKPQADKKNSGVAFLLAKPETKLTATISLLLDYNVVLSFLQTPCDAFQIRQAESSIRSEPKTWHLLNAALPITSIHSSNGLVQRPSSLWVPSHFEQSERLETLRSDMEYRKSLIMGSWDWTPRP